jgi:hypothetical protein
LTYEDARPWAKAIRDEVLNRRMPPWDAVKGVGEFQNDASLSLPEMDLVVNWVEGGAPEGNPDYLPAKPKPIERAPDPHAVERKLTGPIKLTSALNLTGIRPEGALELAALFPDGAVRRLIWIHSFHPKWNRTYWLRSPVHLPEGTQLILSGARASIYANR